MNKTYLVGPVTTESATEAAKLATGSGYNFRDTERALIAANPGDIVHNANFNFAIIVLSGVRHAVPVA